MIQRKHVTSLIYVLLAVLAALRVFCVTHYDGGQPVQNWQTVDNVGASEFVLWATGDDVVAASVVDGTLSVSIEQVIQTLETNGVQIDGRVAELISDSTALVFYITNGNELHAQFIGDTTIETGISAVIAEGLLSSRAEPSLDAYIVGLFIDLFEGYDVATTTPGHVEFYQQPVSTPTERELEDHRDVYLLTELQHEEVLAWNSFLNSWINRDILSLIPTDTPAPTDNLDWMTPFPTSTRHPIGYHSDVAKETPEEGDSIIWRSGEFTFEVIESGTGTVQPCPTDDLRWQQTLYPTPFPTSTVTQTPTDTPTCPSGGDDDYIFSHNDSDWEPRGLYLVPTDGPTPAAEQTPRIVSEIGTGSINVLEYNRGAIDQGYLEWKGTGGTDDGDFTWHGYNGFNFELSEDTGSDPEDDAFAISATAGTPTPAVLFLADAADVEVTNKFLVRPNYASDSSNGTEYIKVEGKTRLNGASGAVETGGRLINIANNTDSGAISVNIANTIDTETNGDVTIGYTGKVVTLGGTAVFILIDDDNNDYIDIVGYINFVDSSDTVAFMMDPEESLIYLREEPAPTPSVPGGSVGFYVYDASGTTGTTGPDIRFISEQGVEWKINLTEVP